MNSVARSIDRPLTRLGVRAADYISLMKPELTGLSVFTALFGAYLGLSGAFDARTFLVVLAGTLLVGGGAGALNQLIERREDALMRRTERRPLPSSRIRPAEALVLGAITSGAGILLLFLAGNPLSGMAAFITWASYLFLYTPLKKITPASTLIGGIPGALPPVIGWTVARGTVGVEAGILFLMLFAWQMPHFYSLAWMYRRDYARAGYAILTVRDVTGIRTARRMIFYSGALCLFGVAAAAAGMAGPVSAAVSALLGAGMLLLSVMFHASVRRGPSEDQQGDLNRLARRIFFASLVYLPLVILAISADSF